MDSSNITAKIICDSIAPNGARITTYVLNFPRIVLAEFNTHRAISKNSASSRAIPAEKMIHKVKENPFVPMKFMKAHKRMQGTEYFDQAESIALRMDWIDSSKRAVIQAEKLLDKGLTKQMINRILEPYTYHTVICTATDWENFFALRAHPEAEIHIQDLADKMLVEYNCSIPVKRGLGEWHIPFGEGLDTKRLLEMGVRNSMELDILKVKIATARCARISYLNFEGKDDYSEDLKLHNRLLSDGHMSPFEHCAQPTFNLTRSGNFNGWKQYRKTIDGEDKSDPRVLKRGL